MSQSPSQSLTQSPSRSRRWCLRSSAVLAVFNAVTAAGGAVCLALGVISLGDELTARLPWGSPVVGGVALLLTVAVPNAVLAALALRRDPRTGAVAVVTGTLLVGWILVELAFIRELSFFHPLYAGIGLALLGLGARLLALHGLPPTTLLREVRDVLVDLPVFLTAPLFRRRHLRWGATDAELAAPMAGDVRIPRPAYLSTRAIDVAAPPGAVWPWLVQVGCLRAGFYSDDLLDNLGRPSARRIDPELQDLDVGALVPMSPRPSPTTAFTVVAYDEPSILLWATPTSTWSWLLVPTREGGTRLVTRIRATYDWRHHPFTSLLGVVLLELGDFAMLRRMLRGIKERAELGPEASRARDGVRGGSPPP